MGYESAPGPYQRLGGNANLLGMLSVMSGLLGTGCCCCPNGLPFVGGVPALVLGYLHLDRVRKGLGTARWLGVTGIVLGAIAVLLGIASFFWSVLDLPFSE